MSFSVATTEAEFEQIHRLNHDTFCIEIPQHPRREDRRLADRFHAENTYVVGKRGAELVAMVALRDRRPFSLDAKLPGLDDWLPEGRRTGEVRLLAIRPDSRQRRALAGLMRELWRVAAGRGLDMLVISGTTRQLGLYRQLGFEPFGPRVGTAEAAYQPMCLRRETLNLGLRSVRQARPAADPVASPLSPSLPRVAACVLDAAAAHPRPHRGDAVADLLRRVRGRLCAATGAQDVQVLSGTGTFANDAIAAQLAARPGRGLVLVNGEFGERLAAHAAGARAVVDVLRIDWEHAFDFEAIAASRAAQPPAWAWMVHCETSTGRMNDADAFRAMCRRLGCLAVLDCVSSLGNVPVSIDGIAFASGVSGKGLAGLTGLALVFHRSDALCCPRDTRACRAASTSTATAAPVGSPGRCRRTCWKPSTGRCPTPAGRQCRAASRSVRPSVRRPCARQWWRCWPPADCRYSWRTWVLHRSWSPWRCRVRSTARQWERQCSARDSRSPGRAPTCARATGSSWPGWAGARMKRCWPRRGRWCVAAAGAGAGRVAGSLAA
ncbi:MAG: aminotransferase class V-fold PLP-dependent enzyme [bacterium]